MAENRTLPTGRNVDDLIDAVPDEGRREDARALRALMARLSGKPAALWGPSIVGFGEYAYRYESGRAGRMARIGFSPRARETVIYLLDGHSQRAGQLARLGRHRTGKSCLYIRRLADIDLGVLEEMIRDSLEHMREKYPDRA